MDDLTFNLLIYGLPSLILILFCVEICVIVRSIKKSTIFTTFKNYPYISYDISKEAVLAQLYGKNIWIGSGDNDCIIFSYLDNYIAVKLEDFISIKRKNNKCTFRLAKATIMGIKSFTVKCEDDRLDKILNIGTGCTTQVDPEVQKVQKQLAHKSTIIFAISAIVYVVCFVIFAILGKWLYYFITTLLFILGLFLFIFFHNADDDKNNSSLSKSEIIEKKAKNKLFYMEKGAEKYSLFSQLFE